MYYAVNNFMNKDYRLISVYKDIQLEYPSITTEKAIAIATHEIPIKESYKDTFMIHEIAIKRLYSIMSILSGNYSEKIEYNHAYRDFLDEYKLWLLKKNENSENLLYIFNKVKSYENNEIGFLPSLMQIEKEEKDRLIEKKLQEEFKEKRRMLYTPNEKMMDYYRIENVKTDILKGFPEITEHIARILAKLEPPIPANPTKEQIYKAQIYRLSNVMSYALYNKLDSTYNDAFRLIKIADTNLKGLIGIGSDDDIACNIMRDVYRFNQALTVNFPNYPSVKRKINKK